MRLPHDHLPAQRWWRPRWYELLPEIVLVAGLTWFLVDEPDAATSAFRSTRAIGLMVAAALAWIVGRVALARFFRWRLARTALFGLAALGALAVVVLPAYRDTTVVEAFPIAAATAADGPSATTVPRPTSPASAAPPTPEPSARETATSTPATTVPATTAVPTTTPPEPLRLRTGPFMGIDHRAAGTVSIYRTPDGRHVVGLEDFDIQPGPDYDVYVVPGADREDHDGGTRLDDLRGNQGTQYYEVPREIDIGQGEWTVLIWCQTFGVPVANASPL
jgi:hypothetical protein